MDGACCGIWGPNAPGRWWQEDEWGLCSTVLFFPLATWPTTATTATGCLTHGHLPHCYCCADHCHSGHWCLHNGGHNSCGYPLAQAGSVLWGALLSRSSLNPKVSLKPHSNCSNWWNMFLLSKRSGFREHNLEPTLWDSISALSDTFSFVSWHPTRFCVAYKPPGTYSSLAIS